MCGRYVLVMGEDGVEEVFLEGDFDPDDLKRMMGEGRVRIMESSRSRPRRATYSSYNIAPTHLAPIIVNRDGSRKMELARWSFVPSWWKAEDSALKFATFNARDDKLKSSGYWRGALDGHRCMVPASGFYEWKRSGKERLPFYIHRKDGQLMAFAGIYSQRTDPETGRPESSFSVITTASNQFMSDLHDRQPLVFGGVEDELWSVWLDPQTKFHDVERHVASREWPEMAMHRVSTDVNATGKARYMNDPHLIEPTELGEGGQLSFGDSVPD